MAIAERRDTVFYLRELSSLLGEVAETRKLWIGQLSPLLHNAEKRDPLVVARSAVTLGRAHLVTFRGARDRLRGLHPPIECINCHAAAVSWLDEHVAACERLVRAGETRDVRSLKNAQEPLADARACAQRITAEYGRLVDDLRRDIPRRPASRSSWFARLRGSPN